MFIPSSIFLFNILHKKIKPALKGVSPYSKTYQKQKQEILCQNFFFLNFEVKPRKHNICDYHEVWHSHIQLLIAVP